MVKKTTLYNSDKEKLYPRTSAECVGYGDGTVKDALDSTGVGDYPAFSALTAYSAGDVVNYNGGLYKFTADHAAGAWTGTDAEETDIIKAHIVQELGDSKNIVVSQSRITTELNSSTLLPVYLYKESYRISNAKKYNKMRKVVLDMYIKLAKGDSNRYQVTQITLNSSGRKAINIYIEDSTGKFKTLACSFSNTSQNYLTTTLDNGTIIYIYVDWHNLTESVTVNEEGAFSDDSLYSLHAGYIKDEIEKDAQLSINTKTNTRLNSLESVNKTKDIDNNRFFIFVESINIEKITICNSVFQDIFIQRADTVLSVGLLYILYDKTIGEKKYTSINIKEYLNDETTVDTLISAKVGTGIELLEYKTTKGTLLKMLVNWGIFNSKTEQQYNYYGIELLDTYYEEHYGLISLIEQNNKLLDYSKYDQMYIWDSKVICNNNNKDSKNVVAKYAQVDMVSNISIAKIRFIATKTFTTTLVITNLKTRGNIGNITYGSIHICFHRNFVAFGLYVNNHWDYQRVEYSNLNIGQEYVVGVELLGSNQIKMLLPDKTDQTFNIEELDNYVGNRFIFEHYFTNTDSEIKNNVDGYSPFTGVYCKGTESNDILKDNFKRQNGSLGSAPTGQTYVLFHNIGDEERTEFDN